MPAVVGNGEDKSHLMERDFGRFGGTFLRAEAARLASSLGVRPGERVLVLGSGEFVHPPFLLAEALEAAGADVWVQATTRSPAMVGHAMTSVLEFRDNYGDGIPNYLYNVRPGQYDRVFVCHETPEGSVDESLIQRLGAEAIRF
jgi:hypothetical protein